MPFTHPQNKENWKVAGNHKSSSKDNMLASEKVRMASEVGFMSKLDNMLAHDPDFLTLVAHFAAGSAM